MADISQWATTAGGNDTGSTPDFPVEGMAPSAVNDTMRTNMAAIKRWYDDLKGYGLTTAGTGDAYTLTSTVTHAALTDQSIFVCVADRANTGSATLNVDSLGAKTIKKNGDENLIANDIQANQIIAVAYDNTADVYHLLTPPAAALDGLGSTTGADISVAASGASSASKESAFVTAGLIMAWPTASVPTGWLECDGSAVSRTTYAELFAVIGVTYGNGDGSTTFNLPDLRGEFIRGFDNTAGNDPDAGSRTDRGDGTTGDNVGTKQSDELGSHNHSGSTGNTSPTVDIDVTDGSGSQGRQISSQVSTNVTNTLNNKGTVDSHSHSISSDGGNESRPRNVYMMWVIKT